MNILTSSLMEQPVEVLRALARGGHYLPCPRCKSIHCKVARVQKGGHDPMYSFPWTRRDIEGERVGRVALTLCEQYEHADFCLRYAIAHPRDYSMLDACSDTQYFASEVRTYFLTGAKEAGLNVRAPKAEHTREEKPVLSAAEIAEKLLDVMAGKPRSMQRLCDKAGIESDQKVLEVLKVLKTRGVVASVLGGTKWRLKDE